MRVPNPVKIATRMANKNTSNFASEYGEKKSLKRDFIERETF